MNSSNSGGASATMTTTIDASAFATPPTNIPKLPTGTYQLPLSTPTALPNTCVDPSLSDAWSCQFPPLINPYQMQVSFIGGANPAADNDILLGWGNNSMDYLSYGAQPPVLHRPQLMFIARDTYDPKMGPAWIFQNFYDKLVIVEEHKLAPPAPNSKREAHLLEKGTLSDFTRKGVAMPGDYPWFCYWNNTFLEVFLYVNDTSAAGASMTTSTAAATTTANSYGWSPAPVGGQGSWNVLPSPPNFLPYYPKVVKIQERRIPSEDLIIPPYCVKKHINGNGDVEPFLDALGNTVTIQLNETEPPIVEPLTKRGAVLYESETYSQDLSERSASAPGTCACAWIIE